MIDQSCSRDRSDKEAEERLGLHDTAVQRWRGRLTGRYDTRRLLPEIPLSGLAVD